MVPKVSAKMPEIPLFPSCLQTRTSIMHVHTRMCHPQPPLAPQKIWRPKSYWKLRYGTLCHWMQNFKFSHQSLRWWWGGVWHQTPPPPPPLNFNLTKSKKSSWRLGVVGGCLAPDPPTTPKLQLDFKSKKSSCSLGVVVGGGSEHHFNQFWHILHLRGWLTYVFTFHVTT